MGWHTLPLHAHIPRITAPRQEGSHGTVAGRPGRLGRVGFLGRLVGIEMACPQTGCHHRLLAEKFSAAPSNPGCERRGGGRLLGRLRRPGVSLTQCLSGKYDVKNIKICKFDSVIVTLSYRTAPTLKHPLERP